LDKSDINEYGPLAHPTAPPVAQDRVRLRADGRVLVEPKTVWRDRTFHLLFEPIECMEKLVALIPRPAINVVVSHGALAPHARYAP
jgi:hypothetical protein